MSGSYERIQQRTGGDVELNDELLGDMRSRLPEVADRAVAAIIEEVPSYADALSGEMGDIIREAVKTALGGFIYLASGRSGKDASAPTSVAVDGAYQLGRGEARQGRTIEALLAAYRIGARVSWRELSDTAVANGASPATLARIAELVFAFIDELSASSVSGHSDELATEGRVRQQLLDRTIGLLIDRAPADACASAAARAGWEPPEQLMAVLVPESQVRPVLTQLEDAVHWSEEPEGASGWALLVTGRDRRIVGDRLANRDVVIGPARNWLDLAGSYERALRALALDHDHRSALDTEAHLGELVVTADPSALADLRAQVLAPLDDLRDSATAKLTETLRMWLLHQGRRDDIAEALFVHPQTVRYRMSQLRAAYSDRLEDPDWVRDATIALAL